MRCETRKFVLLSATAAALAAGVSAVAAPMQKYKPVPGGYETFNGDGEFNRPLYGWHGDDRELAPCKSLPWTSDRPKVVLKVFNGYRLDSKMRGILQFGDGTEDVAYRYVWGRAEYDLKGKGTVKMVRSAASDGLLVETTGDLPPKFGGEWELAAKSTRGGATYYDFERKGGIGRVEHVERAEKDVTAMFDAATNHFERIARTIEIKTPDPLIDSLLPCQLIVADAMFEGRHITHGVTNWKQAFAGWRTGYICYATGWEDRFKENAREHFRSQRKDGRIPNEPKRDSMYNMCEEFVVSVMRYWKWTLDDGFMREIAYDGVKRHLAWMDGNMKVPGFELYENWLDTWNTDNKWCNGGAGTIASAYYAFVCRTMAEVAQRLGKAEDAAYFAARAKTVEDAIAKNLWHEGDGVWGEYRERFGLKRLMRAPDLSTVYIAIDSLPFDLERNRSAVAWVEDNVPTHFAKDGATLLYSSNRLPWFWTSCGRYPNETLFWSLACYQTGEPELGWRHLHDVAAVSARGAGCGPGVGTCDLNYDFACYGNIDFADCAAGFIRTVAEGVFGIIDGREIRPSFPASWNEAEIKSPYVSYRWTRKDGVKVTGGSRADEVKVVAAPEPKFAGAAIPPRHARWGHPKGEGADLSIPAGMKAEHVDLSKAFNQNLRLLHKGKYSPRIANVKWSGIPRTLMANGRSWWNRHEANNRRNTDYCVPKSLDLWPAGGRLSTEYGPEFLLGPADGTNSVFVSFYEQFPDSVEIPLSGRAHKIALLTAVVTNPNVAWMEAAVVKMRYADGTEAALSLVPPDNCDDWLNYSHGHWAYFDPKRDSLPYAVNGRPVMLGGASNANAHANVHAIALDPAKELKSLRFECRGTETFAGLLGATLYRNAQDSEADRPPSAPAKPNYDESKVPPYTLEDPFTFVDGSRVETKSDWRKRRDEILDIFAREMYGQPPPVPEEVVTDLFEEGATLAGLGIRRQYRMWFRKDKSGPHIDWLVLLPNRIGAERPEKSGVGVACENGASCPAILFLNYGGNHELLTDQEVAPPQGWLRNDKRLGITDNKAVETTRGRMLRTDERSIVSVGTILARGYAVVTANYGEVSPDCPTKPDGDGLAWTGVFELWGERDNSRSDLPTSLGAWAWALSRGLDLAERIEEIDAARCVAAGSSRLGKAALLATARDERFAACVANQTGLGGVPLSKRFFGANVATETRSFPHWYCKAYAKCAGDEKSMPFDQHLLLACIAPRALLVEGFNHGWFDPKGEFLAVKAASPVWKFLGADAIPDGEYPDDYSTKLVGKRLGYVRRGGKHGFSAHDWLWMLDFADNALADAGERSVWPLQERIDAIAADGGGTLTLTAGVYRTGALFFKPGVNLHLEKGAVILGVDEAEGYPMRETRIMGETCRYYPALVNADRCDGFTITGDGVIDGHGANTWEEFWTTRAEARKTGKPFHDKSFMRPRVLYVSRSKNVDISGVTFKNSKFWTTHFYDCDDVVVHDCAILADILKDSKGRPLRGPSTDAIDIDKCRRFTVRNVDVSVNDDGVVVKGGKGPWADDYGKFPENGPSADVLVENCTFRHPTHSALTLGSECPAATNVTMRNCTVDGCGDLLHLKMRTDTPQHYANVLVENCRGRCNALLRVAAWGQFHNAQGRAKPELKSYADNVTLRNNDVEVHQEKIWRGDDSLFEVTNMKIE